MTDRGVASLCRWAARDGAGAIAVCALAFLAGGACGKKGPPLPPLVRIPQAPADILAERRGATVEIQLTVPAANTDGSRPANLQRVEVYAMTGPVPGPDAELLKRASRIASIDVKAPRDPDAAVEADEPDADAEPPEGPGLDQGAKARVEERLGAAGPASADPAVGVVARTYVGVAVTRRGRRGPVSKRVAVPLGSAPPAPSAPAVAYTETRVTVSWRPTAAHASGAIPDEALAPSEGRPTGAFVYEVPSGKPVTRLTPTPVAEASFVDTRIEWGAERCYAVSLVEELERGLRVESEPSPSGCVTFVDTFAPKAPTGVTAVASEGAVSLIWNASSEADLAGYIVLRAPAPAEKLTPVSPTPVVEPHYEDSVEPGIPYVYAVEAVDKTGNVGEPSERVELAAR